MMRAWGMRREAHIALLVAGLTFQASPIIWAQEGVVLDDVDPALHAAVQALVAKDPEIAKDPELAGLVREIAEATVLDPRERSAITHEVAAMRREGVDVNTVIPTEVREAAREEFGKVQAQMQEQLETLRVTDPEAAKEMELTMQEGEHAMQAFENGERYVPSPEMVAHSQEMFHDWENEMVTQGAPPEYLEAARTEFAMWSSGETGSMMGGPGQEMMGPGHEGGMPSPEQMQAMVDAGQMTPEQLQMAKDYMQQGGSEGNFGQGGMENQGANPQEAFEHWAATEGQNVSSEQVEQYREMAEQYQQEVEQNRPENQNNDIQAQQLYDQSNPPPGDGSSPPPPPQSEVLVAVHDHDNDGIPDEYHYDTNGDGIEDVASPTPH